MTKKGGKWQPKGNYDYHLLNGDDDVREFNDFDDDADDDANAETMVTSLMIATMMTMTMMMTMIGTRKGGGWWGPKGNAGKLPGRDTTLVTVTSCPCRHHHHHIFSVIVIVMIII